MTNKFRCVNNIHGYCMSQPEDIKEIVLSKGQSEHHGCTCSKEWNLCSDFRYLSEIVDTSILIQEGTYKDTKTLKEQPTKEKPKKKQKQGQQAGMFE